MLRWLATLVLVLAALAERTRRKIAVILPGATAHAAELVGGDVVTRRFSPAAARLYADSTGCGTRAGRSGGVSMARTADPRNQVSRGIFT